MQPQLQEAKSCQQRKALRRTSAAPGPGMLLNLDFRLQLERVQGLSYFRAPSFQLPTKEVPGIGVIFVEIHAGGEYG